MEQKNKKCLKCILIKEAEIPRHGNNYIETQKTARIKDTSQQEFKTVRVHVSK